MADGFVRYKVVCHSGKPGDFAFNYWADDRATADALFAEKSAVSVKLFGSRQLSGTNEDQWEKLGEK